MLEFPQGVLTLSIQRFKLATQKLSSQEEPEIICLVVFINYDNVWSAGLNGAMNHLIIHYPV